MRDFSYVLNVLRSNLDLQRQIASGDVLPPQFAQFATNDPAELARARTRVETLQVAIDLLERQAGLPNAGLPSSSQVAAPTRQPRHRDGRPVRAVVISNCQCQPLKHALSSRLRGVTFDSLGVHLVEPAARAAMVEDFLATARYDLAVTIPLSADFGELSEERVRTTFPDVVTISNMTFAGLHPDLTYIGGLAERVPSPLVDYHSKLAVWGFLKGLTVDQTQALYCDAVYRAAGYYEAFPNSLAELQRRETGVDVPVSGLIPKLIGQGALFHSNNHPSGLLVSHYADAIAGHLADLGFGEPTGWPTSPFATIDHLATSAIFPIYPEIAARWRCPAGSYAFRPLTVGDQPATPLSLREFIEAEYAAFERFRNALPGTYAVMEVERTLAGIIPLAGRA